MLIHLNSDNRDGGTNENPIFDLNSLGRHHTKTGGNIAVKGVEIPFTFFTCVNGVNNRFVYVASNGTTRKTIFLGSSTLSPFEGSPNASSLLAILKAQLDVNVDGAVWTLTLDPTTARVRITSTVNATWDLLDTETFRVLGFDGNLDLISFTANVAVVSPGVINVNPYRHIFLRSNLPITNGYDYDSFNKGNSDILAKIPLTGNAFSNIFYEPNEAEFRQCGTLATSIQFKLTDSKNRPINLNGQPFSLTLDWEQ